MFYHVCFSRLSLFLSSTLAYGMVRIVRNQVATLRRDVGNAKLDLAKSLRLAQTLNEPIDMEVCIFAFFIQRTFTDLLKTVVKNMINMKGCFSISNLLTNF